MLSWGGRLNLVWLEVEVCPGRVPTKISIISFFLNLFSIFTHHRCFFLWRPEVEVGKNYTFPKFLVCTKHQILKCACEITQCFSTTNASKNKGHFIFSWFCISQSDLFDAGKGNNADTVSLPATKLPLYFFDRNLNY